jgi:GIY-YIG catalytic domain
MPIPLVAVLLLAEAVIIVAVQFLIYKFQVKPKAKTTIVAQRRDAPGWVYEFIDPDTGVTVYVGQSVNVEKRVDQHLRASMSTGLLYMWIADLVQHGKRPIVRKGAYGNGKE